MNHAVSYYDSRRLVRRRTLSWFARALLFMGIVSLPLYILPSGMPQISHVLLIAFAAITHRKWLRYTKIHHSVILLVVAFLWWVLVRQGIYIVASAVGGWDFILFFSFNIVCFAALTIVFQNSGPNTSKAVLFAVVLSVGIALVGAAIGGSSIVKGQGEAYRAVGTFNNPNQLGYFSICAAGILLIMLRTINSYRVINILAVIGCAYLSILSLSKSAMIAFCIYALALVPGLKGWGRLVFFLALIALILFIGSADISHLKFIDRLAEVGSDSDDNLEARGYGILFEGGWGALFGWGDGYAQQLIGHEVHSTVGSIWISFGLVGLLPLVVLYLKLASSLIRTSGLIYAAGILLPTAIYGIAHNGFRFTVFWVFLAVCCSYAAVGNMHGKGRV